MIDLADVSFIDSRSLGELVAVRAELPTHVALNTGRARPQTARIFERVHSAELFVFGPPVLR